MFSFGFSLDEKENSSVSDSCESSHKWIACKELTFDCDPLLPPSSLFTQDDISLELASSEEVLKIIKENQESCITAADSQHSDLLPAIYEGGLKVWECTNDLLKFISQPNFKSLLNGAKILDLGCGAGLLGIFALLNEANLVHFQDYNEEVLKYYTRPNIALNFAGENLTERVKFFCGDWGSFAEQDPNSKYDFIFTSETIYNQECYTKLIKLFESKLSDTGKVLVAAKSYYFGVGGGTRQFEDALEANKLLTSEVVWKTDSGLIREIIQITKLQS